MKIATTIGEMYPYSFSPADAVAAYEGTGFHYLDYSFYNVISSPNNPFMSDGWKKTVEGAKNTAESLGFKFVQAHAPACAVRGKESEIGILATQRSIEACGMLGIPNAVLHTSYSRQHLYPADREAYFEYNRKFICELLPIAEKNNVTLCIENSSFGNMQGMYFFMTAAEMNEFIAYMDHPLIGACWDTGHALMEGKSDQYKDLLELGANLKAVHIHDNNGRDSHLAPYCGKLQLDSIVRGLKDVSFKGYFTFEADNFLSRTNGSGVLSCLPLDIHIDGLAILYKIGKNALEKYDCFEE